ncbi:MAG: 5-bromo-4-chloroindolyl phosphate hydrolysis family protein [Geminicoccaceae bacterium]|nr:5-bromo-4-chloroindolyl phosphate hydrolysis family protein [Geminicoccaceae bacterium]
MSQFSRRVGSGVDPAQQSPQPGSLPVVAKPMALRILPLFIALPAISGLMTGSFFRTLGAVASFGLLIVAGTFVQKGLEAEASYNARRIARPPGPRKLFGAALVAASVFCLAWLSHGSGLFMSILYAVLGGGGCVMAYGLDPMGRKDIDEDLAARAGLRSEDVIEAVSEAENKIREIELNARELHNRELSERLGRIAARARAVLAQVERTPGDLRRARRFFVTYLDGTRDVVRKYREQQNDLANTPLAESFRHVLETVEKVFGEQEEVLKRNDSLDLEVQIDVLRTQLEKEGVH